MKFVLHQCPLKLVTEKSPLIKLKKLWLSHGTGKWATRLLQSTQVSGAPRKAASLSEVHQPPAGNTSERVVERKWAPSPLCLRHSHP